MGLPTRARHSRRRFITQSGAGFAGLAIGTSLAAVSRPVWGKLAPEVLGELGDADDNQVRLPAGFRSRIVASSGRRVRRRVFEALDYRWHIYPDGGATFAADDGGWIYVSNSEAIASAGGGVSALRFDAHGEIADAYRILENTNLNCAGGPTPWQTWLSCEEIPFGRVFECDPRGQRSGEPLEALGFFKHEAATVDGREGILYLTEDEPDGRFYRFTPDAIGDDGVPNLSAGRLQVARFDRKTERVDWLDLLNPTPSVFQTPTRHQRPESTAFNGGEGVWHHAGKVYFTTKGDNRVWCYLIDDSTLTVIYDAAEADNPILTGVDNVTVAPSGQILVAEDGGNMQIVIIDSRGTVKPLLQVVGQDSSEITGPAFSPDGSRFYFSSQRGSRVLGGSGFGLTYEIEGPFVELLGGVG